MADARSLLRGTHHASEVVTCVEVVGVKSIPKAGAHPGEGEAEGAARERRQFVRMLVGAAITAAALIVGVVVASVTGLLPARIVDSNAAVAPPPPTTNPETTAIGSEPVWEVQCGFGGPTGAGCTLLLADISGNLVTEDLTVEVPRRWLSALPHPTRVNNMRVLAALVQSRYAPLDGEGMANMAISVEPSFARRLKTVGITPVRFLDWLYQNVPHDRWPPWLPTSHPAPAT